MTVPRPGNVAPSFDMSRIVWPELSITPRLHFELAPA
jgi:hypothetical protein